MSAVIIAANTDGTRNTPSDSLPVSHIVAARIQCVPGGLCVLGTPVCCGMIQLPVANISLAG